MGVHEKNGGGVGWGGGLVFLQQALETRVSRALAVVASRSIP